MKIGRLYKASMTFDVVQNENEIFGSAFLSVYTNDNKILDCLLSFLYTLLRL